MTEVNEDPYTPFDPSTFTKGGGGWADTEVLITSARFVIETWADKDGKIPRKRDDKGNLTDQPMDPQTMFEVKGIAQIDGEPKERREIYSCGKTFDPTADGMGLAKKGSVTRTAPFGEPGKLNENSATAKFLAALHNTGFPFTSLRTADGKPYIAGLEGAVLLMKGENKLDKDGKPKKNDAGYEQFIFYPAAYIKEKSAQGTGGARVAPKTGGASGAAKVGTAAPVQAGAVQAGDAGSADEEARNAVLLVVAEKGTVTRADLLKSLPPGITQAAKLLMVKEPFLKSIEGVSYDKGTLTLS